MTDLQQHIALLRHYNAWRRDNPDNTTPLEMPNPREVGIAMDAVLDAVEELQAIAVCARTLANFCDWAEPFDGDEYDRSEQSLVYLSNGDVHRVWAARDVLERCLNEEASPPAAG